MKTLYFSNCSLRTAAGIDPIGPGKQIPQAVIDSMKPEEIEKLVAKRRISVVDPTAHAAKAAPAESDNPGVWKFTLEETSKLSLDALNMLIQEHAQKNGLPAVEPCITKEEAQHFLAQDLRS